jgi:RHS repeat-associated protein
MTGNKTIQYTAYSYTDEYYGDSTQLTYLRSRYYSSGTGRFLTRDTWEGSAISPMSYSRWMYVDGNPINLTDPSGMCAKGKCGPDLTEWVRNQLQSHYDYGLKIRNETSRMRLLARLHFYTNCTFDSLLLNPLFLKDIATEQPFRDILSHDRKITFLFRESTCEG